MSNDQPQQHIAVFEDMLADENAGTHATVKIGPFSAMLLVAAIQHTMRTGALPGGPAVAQAAFGSLLNQLDELVSRYPGAMEIILSQNPTSPTEGRGHGG
ncbi:MULTISPECIES: hypothetical protein [unclassified Amycolatopsis]|uniref:hypothetical protein n=1 Tax=unclassified Amycolatopsis TaxID=2618356 RepID=UPI0028758122|nr:MULTISPECIES: hypothetical protein [unclassified Amycolatopsis]MDS0140543.1 hypothetical protein [Amycolatopsis sp. 505]MDS0149193.1 hypothetical protein [Amycolatopsis sp. CM201R]